jgi:hypothetical protein
VGQRQCQKRCDSYDHQKDRAELDEKDEREMAAANRSATPSNIQPMPTMIATVVNDLDELLMQTIPATRSTAPPNRLMTNPVVDALRVSKAFAIR